MYTLDLTERPEFALHLPKENWSNEEYETPPLVKIDHDGTAISVGMSKIASVRSMSRRMSDDGAKFKAPKMANAGYRCVLGFCFLGVLAGLGPGRWDARATRSALCRLKPPNNPQPTTPKPTN